MVYSLCEQENPTPSNFQISIQASLELPVAMYVCHAQFLLPHGHPFRSGGSWDSHSLSQVSWLVLYLLLLSLVITPPWWVDPAPFPIASCQCKLIKDAQLLSSSLTCSAVNLQFSPSYPCRLQFCDTAFTCSETRRLLGLQAVWHAAENSLWNTHLFFLHSLQVWYLGSLCHLLGKHLPLLVRALPTCFLGIPYSCSTAYQIILVSWHHRMIKHWQGAWSLNIKAIQASVFSWFSEAHSIMVNGQRICWAF